MLAWPLPYTTALSGVLDGFTELTAGAITLITKFVPIAQPDPGFDGSVFAVANGGHTFLVAIASACSGVNSVVGFLLIGLALGVVVHGSVLPKTMWLIGGMGLVWVLNILRILLVFAVGRIWGEQVAVDWIHPVIGLLFFNAGVLAMLFAMRLFRLNFWNRRSAAIDGRPAFAAPSRLAVARAGAACTVVLIAGTIGMVANSRMQQYELVAHDVGSPRLSDMSVASASVAGWSLAQTDSYSWARQYFGPKSSWVRYQYDWKSQAGAGSAFQSSEPVVMDVISTDDLYTFSTYGLETCYRFHGYRVMDSRTIALAGGVTGHAVTYFNPSLDSEWIAVYWEWPVRASSGNRYERVILNLLNPTGEHLAGPVLASQLGNLPQLKVNDWLLGAPSGRLSPSMTTARDFLIGFGQEVVSSAAMHSAHA
jgi:exosortase/archaeosortase family protein